MNLPEKDEKVRISITKEEDFGYFVSLIDYDNAEGMILKSAMSIKRSKRNTRIMLDKLKKAQLAGDDLFAEVLKVDKKGYIDLQLTFD